MSEIQLYFPYQNYKSKKPGQGATERDFIFAKAAGLQFNDSSENGFIKNYQKTISLFERNNKTPSTDLHDALSRYFAQDELPESYKLGQKSRQFDGKMRNTQIPYFMKAEVKTFDYIFNAVYQPLNAIFELLNKTFALSPEQRQENLVRKVNRVLEKIQERLKPVTMWMPFNSSNPKVNEFSSKVFGLVKSRFTDRLNRDFKKVLDAHPNPTDLIKMLSTYKFDFANEGAN